MKSDVMSFCILGDDMYAFIHIHLLVDTQVYRIVRHQTSGRKLPVYHQN